MCRPEPLACAASLDSALPASATGSTAGGEDRFGDAPCAMGGGAGVPDLAFQWTAPAAGRYEISTEGSSFDTVLTVRRGGCEGGEILDCNDDVGSSRQARLSVELEACETILIVVDGFAARENGAVRLSISGRESLCDDGIDNDGDGLIDCDDDDCRSRECIEDGAWPPAWSDFEWRVLELTNERRAQGASCGGESFGPAGPLEMNEAVRLAARLHSQDMGARNYFDHQSLDGRTFAQRMSQAGYGGATPWGENIAAGQPTPERVVQGWMESPGHCRNVMNPSFRVLGVGYALEAGSQFGHYWTQNFGGGH